MSSSSPQPPDLDRVEKGFKAVTSLTNTLTEFLRWVAGMIRKREWVELLMFAIAVAIVFWGTKLTLAQVIQEPVFYRIWIILGVVLLVGVILELRKKPPLKIISRDLGKRKAIKFLSSFEQEDGEIYRKLQGYRDLGFILENIVRPEFSFGILKGKSGCGKSSYLKAGLLAELAKNETYRGYRGVYLKFSDEDSLETIREALVDLLKLPKAEIESLNFLELLRKAIETASQSGENFKPLILIFDQFEQFFVYTDNEAKREDFIQDLANWYNDDELKEKVKILVSIREDWFARMDEIQEKLNYTLRIGSSTGSNSFYLKNFSAQEATMILKVMAQEDLGIEENDSIRFDRDYIQKVLKEELASPTDPLISPVDLQIIAETIKQQNTVEMRAFNRRALQKLGGIEGLRRSFLESILEPLGAERKKSAVQVLVSLTNLGQQTRAKVQTLTQLQEKLKGTVTPNEVEKLVTNLQETGLIAVVEREGTKGYELTHEGMISAVIRLGEKIQDKTYRANQLLERRVNEWLGNNRSSRYLFNLEELWLIERQKRNLNRGSKWKEKQELITKSKKLIYRNFGVFGGVLLLVMGIWGWSNYTTAGQLTQIRWQLADVSQQINNYEYKVKAVEAFVKDRNFPQALKLANQIESSSDQASALRAIAEAISQLEQPEKAAEFLAQALDSANQIEDSRYQAYVLRAIAQAISQLKQPEKAADLLAQALDSANQIESSSDQASALRAIAEAISQLEQPEKAAEFLAQALDSANQIEDSRYQAYVLRAIAQAYNQLKQPEKAADLLAQALDSANQIEDSDDQADALSAIAQAYNQLKQPEKAADLLAQALDSANQIEDSRYQAYVLRAIAQAYNQLKQPEKAADLLAQALTSANQIEDSFYQADALSAIAQAYNQLKQPEKAADLLAQALTSANQIEDSFYQAYALSAIAQAISQLKQPEKAADLLAQALDSANQIESSSDQASALRAIAEAISQLEQPEKAAEFLAQALTSANQIEDSRYQADALRAIAQAYNQLEQPEKAAELLAQALTSANQIEDSDDQAYVLRAIAQAEANLKNWGQALKVTQKCPSVDCEVDSLARVLTIYAEQQHPELKEEEENN